MGGVVGGAGAGVVPPGKGLRGMLDNIVNDGMRVATEVRRRYDEAQKELDKEARHGREDEEDEEEVDAKDLDRCGCVKRRSTARTLVTYRYWGGD